MWSRGPQVIFIRWSCMTSAVKAASLNNVRSEYEYLWIPIQEMGFFVLYVTCYISDFHPLPTCPCSLHLKYAGNIWSMKSSWYKRTQHYGNFGSQFITERFSCWCSHVVERLEWKRGNFGHSSPSTNRLHGFHFTIYCRIGMKLVVSELKKQHRIVSTKTSVVFMQLCDNLLFN
jgi:hypothetical protein